MASNFRIVSQRNSDRLHLKLTGDMDGNSAYEIINLLDENSNGIEEVVIETSGLTTIFPFGQSVFFKNFHKIKNRYAEILFTGDKSNQINPEKN
jgi:anti-anti-sigma regulatory factor